MTMERWLGVCRFLTSNEMAHLSHTSRDVRAVVEAVAVIFAKESPALAFLFADTSVAFVRLPRISIFQWLRCVELQLIKSLLLHASSVAETAGDDVDFPAVAWTSSAHVTVLVSKAFVLTSKKQCDRAEKLLRQGPKAVSRLRELASIPPSSKKHAKAVKQVRSDLAAMQLLEDREIAHVSDSITCSHDGLLPLSLSKGQGKRLSLPLAVWRKLLRYVNPGADRVFGAGRPATECDTCLTTAKLEQMQVEEKKTQRLLLHTESGGGDSLYELLARKTGYPPSLLSPERGRFYIVPQSWLKRWRQYVKSVVDEVPGPILNGALLCSRHRKPVVPNAIALFLMGASTSVLSTIPGITYALYEIVTETEWDQLQDSFCAEVAVGFDVVCGTIVWRTLPCQVCEEPTESRPKKANRNNNSNRRTAYTAPAIRL
ncbi:hypothetical protein SDRG_02522 [Saprolegnia diclina VS20]|uniref:DUSP domain-containing protein n=1 Tax=Saprolegnia diclina (strain VS20) TaxID=1156394 RepID=T0QP22_SAPDV|nr:hypothetical protein SDRG_02522 [Saprolegnia diclina VS20]EQC39864.1 hypothetical protein SDRG_02522 [Saprolegnia diclina VS20]|eukprot:XP_008606338.1 hypothetical protein SDRG_02522 [Saprolegnia diclina VS20]